jgi:AcrR family transcriptional regulator
MPLTLDRDAPPSSDVVARAVAATLACVARTGLAKLTVDDVAREAGVSRATLYRTFSSRQALVAAAADHEAARIGAAIAAAVADATGLDDVVTAVIVTGGRELRANAALAFVAAHEPEVLAPHLEFAGGDRLYRRLGRGLAPFFAPWVDDPERAAEWVARVGLSLLWSPAPLVDLADEDAVRRLVSTFVTPGIAAPASAVSAPEEG